MVQLKTNALTMSTYPCTVCYLVCLPLFILMFVSLYLENGSAVHPSLRKWYLALTCTQNHLEKKLYSIPLKGLVYKSLDSGWMASKVVLFDAFFLLSS